MQKVVSVETMRNSDKFTIENHISSKDLMAKAGNAIFESVDWFGKICIVCGKGNNAGDGFVLAPLLKKSGFYVEIVLLEEKFSSDGKYFFDRCIQEKIPFSIYSDKTDFNKFNFIVDCILGTGFKGNVQGNTKEVIHKINNAFGQIISVDINSGLNGDNGLCEEAVKSALTVSIGYLKTGHFLNNAKNYVRKVINKNIDIVLKGEEYNLVEMSDLKTLFPNRNENSNKGNFGYVGILGGSENYSGAIKLANMASVAMRSGCGVCRVIAPKSLANAISPYLLESTFFGVNEKNGQAIFDKNEIDNALKGLKALAIGMGWNQSTENEKILTYILQNYSLPIIIDADGLNTLAKLDKSILKQTNCKVILTPHLKEFERLSMIEIDEVKQKPIFYAKQFAKENNVVLLLKGSTTIVTNGEEIYIVSTGCSGMATAGSGDVLSGIIVGLLGYNTDLLSATYGGAFINGKAGEYAEKKTNSYSMIASDTIKEIANVITEIINL